MKTNLFSVPSLVLSLVNLVLVSYLFIKSDPPTIGYIYNDRLFSEYNGIKDSRDEYQQTVNAWQQELDSLESDINRTIESYRTEFQHISDRERQLQSQEIKNKQEKYYALQQSVEEKKQAHDLRISSAILKQIDSYIQDYGKTSEYDFIIGVTDAGNLLYANEKQNLTDVVINGLNEKYEGMQ